MSHNANLEEACPERVPEIAEVERTAVVMAERVSVDAKIATVASLSGGKCWRSSKPSASPRPSCARALREGVRCTERMLQNRDETPIQNEPPTGGMNSSHAIARPLVSGRISKRTDGRRWLKLPINS